MAAPGPVPCPKPGCKYHIVLLCCRGTRTPENKGYWYQSCNAPADQSHFIRWATEMPRTEIHTPQLPPSLQSLLTMPLTPQKLLPRNAGVGSSLSPTRDSPNAPTSVPDSVPDSVTPDLEVPDAPDHDAMPANATAGTSSGADNDGLPHTRTAIKRGKALIACNGSVCRSQPAKEPVRNCVTCAFEFCKKCCLAYQSVVGKLCAQHPPPITLANGMTASHPEHSSSTPTAAGTDEANLNRPLRQEHYDARDRAQKDWEIRKNQLTQQKIAVDALKRTVTILYWKNDQEPDAFTVPCPRFPVFDLNSCVAVVREEMGVPDDGKLVETFDPEQGRWASHGPSTPRDISSQPSLLYRARGIKTGIDMELEVKKILDRGKSRKRPVDLLLQTPHVDRRVRPRVNSTAPGSARPKAKESPDVIDLNDSDSDAPSTTVALFVKREVVTPPLKGKSTRLLSGPVKTKRTMKPTTSATLAMDADSEDEDILAEKASSGHAAWPLKYVASMAEGFREMATMTGTVRSRFESAFGSKYPGSKATWNTHSNIWEAATDEQKNRYIKAGFSTEGLWKSFRREVEDAYGGKIPGKREHRGEEKPKVKGCGTLRQVKAEPQDEDIIIIDSD